MGTPRSRDLFGNSAARAFNHPEFMEGPFPGLKGFKDRAPAENHFTAARGDSVAPGGGAAGGWRWA